MTNILLEETQLQRGIFWIKDINDISASNLYFTIPCDSNGNTMHDTYVEYTSKDGKSYNHENTWKKLSSKETNNKPFNYYPRGRVEIRNGKAMIYCSPFIYGDELEKWCIDKFNLTSVNGIKKVTMHADNSEHYKCYLSYDY